MTIPQAFSEAARRHGDLKAISGYGVELTHTQLDACITRAAAALERRGIGPGTVVGVSLETSPTHLVTVLALARAGACSVQVNATYPQPVRDALARQLGISVFVGDGRNALAVDADWVRPGEAAAHEIRVTADAPWRIGLSSGTTGLQKAVRFSHAQSLAYLKLHNAAIPVCAEDRFLCHRGLDSGLTLHAVLCHLAEGGRVVFPASRSIEHFVEAMDRHAATQAVLSPAYLRDLLERLPAGGPRFPSFTRLRVAGSQLQPALYEAGIARVSPNLIATYGATELGLIAFADREARRRAPRTVGRLAPGLEGQAVDDADRPLPPGASGALRFRREGMAREYVANPEASAKTFRHGWVYPGDTGRIDADGLLFIEGRVDDKLNLDGVKVEPGPVEQALHEHPSVLEAAAFAAAPERGPAALFAAVVPRMPVHEKELLAYCRGRIGPMHTPMRIFIVDKLPRNEAGKVLRAELASRITRRPS